MRGRSSQSGSAGLPQSAAAVLSLELRVERPGRGTSRGVPRPRAAARESSGEDPRSFAGRSSDRRWWRPAGRRSACAARGGEWVKRRAPNSNDGGSSEENRRSSPKPSGREERRRRLGGEERRIKTGGKGGKPSSGEDPWHSLAAERGSSPRFIALLPRHPRVVSSPFLWS